VPDFAPRRPLLSSVPMARRAPPLLLLSALALLAGCENRVGAGRTLDVELPARSDGSVIRPDTGVDLHDAGLPVDAGRDAGVPEDAGLVIQPFTAATVGTACVNGAQRLYLVLSAGPARCADHAQVVLQGPQQEAVAWAELTDLPGPGARSVPAQVCLTPGTCQARTLDLQVTQSGAGQPLVGRWSIGLDGVRAEGDLAASWCDYTADAPGGGGTLATGLSMSEVAFYQGVKIPVAQGGQAITDLNAPLVAGRPALVRVFVQPQAGFQSRDLVARLTLEAPGQAPVTVEDALRVTRASTEELPDTTFNLDVPADAMAPGMQVRVGLYETSGCGGGDPAGVLYPTSGLAPLQVKEAGDRMKIVLVPVRYNADGSGRLPDTSSAQVDRYTSLMFGMFPVPGVSVTVRAPFEWDSAISRNGSGWSNILQAILNLRNADNPDANVYYYGIFVPAQTFSQYCSGGCVTGLGPVPGPRDEYSRGAVGVGFSGQDAPGTFVHEIGHALGREHAPCQTSDYDQAFPYTGGRLGVWGFDLVTRTLKEPNDNRDLMGYCDPAWISDYTYDAMLTRIATVNGVRPLTTPAPAEFKVLMDDMDGVRWGDSVILRSSPQGEPVAAVWRDAAGVVLAQDVAFAYALDHLEGRYLLIPAPPEGARTVTLPGLDPVEL
jgi:hypothetical protein